MGHTTSSPREAVKELLDELRRFDDGLTREEQRVFESMLATPLNRVGAISNARSLHVWSFVLITILLEHEQRLREVEDVVDTGHVPEQTRLTHGVDADRRW